MKKAISLFFVLTIILFALGAPNAYAQTLATNINTVESLGIVSEKDTYEIGEEFSFNSYYILPIANIEQENDRLDLTNKDVVVDLSRFSTKAVGTTEFTVSYKGAKIKKIVKVVAQPLSKAVIKVIGSTAYTGAHLTPELEIKTVAGIILKKGVDYNVQYFDNVLAGTATAKITAVKNSKNISGDTVFTFDIGEKDIKDTTVVFEKAQRYTGLPIMPKITIKYKDEIVDEKLYTIYYSDNINHGIGTAKITIKGTTNSFVGTKTEAFNIIDNVLKPIEEENLFNGVGFSFNTLNTDEKVGKSESGDIIAQDARLIIISMPSKKYIAIEKLLEQEKIILKGSKYIQKLETRIWDKNNKPIALSSNISFNIRISYPEGVNKNSNITAYKYIDDKLLDKQNIEKFNGYFEIKPKAPGSIVVVYNDEPNTQKIEKPSSTDTSKNQALSTSKTTDPPIQENNKRIFPVLEWAIILALITIISIILHKNKK